MKIPHKEFCILPWVSLETSPTGTVRPCCLAIDEIVNDNGEKFHLSNAKFSEIQNSNHMKNLRQQFVDGIRPASCQRCWDEEDSGRTSKRMHTLDRLKDIIVDETWNTDAKPLIFLDLKLGNICNLKCRICGSWSSSTFAVEELEYDSLKKESYHYIMIKDGRWPRDNPDFWNEIDSIVDQIRYLEFTGGEPFMIKEHFKFLEAIVDKGIAGQVEIHYNTNGTQFPENAENIWQHFKLVEIAFSIDDVRERFEYQRANAIWEEVEYNIARFDAMRMRNPNIQLQVCITVNVFNVMYLEEVANWADAQRFDFIYWNMLHEAPHNSIARLPADVKNIIEHRLSNISVGYKNSLEIKKIIDFMNNGESMDIKILKENIAKVDSRRAQNLKNHHPELAKALNYNGPN